MGLLDQILGRSAQGGRGGMSPLTMLLLGVLAYRAYQGRGGGGGGGLGDVLGRGQPRGANPTGGNLGNPSPGGLGDLLRGGLGGLLAGGAAGGATGGMLSGALRELVDRFQQSGHGDVAHSWVGTGPNRAVTPDQMRDALGEDTVSSLAEQAGINEVDLLNGLSQDLPEAVDQLTPEGRVPTEQEAAARWA
ncbi:MAG: YidB family protein [Xanthobacteraceae bacterium]